jgi:hypothetical protein
MNISTFTVTDIGPAEGPAATLVMAVQNSSEHEVHGIRLHATYGVGEGHPIASEDWDEDCQLMPEESMTVLRACSLQSAPRELWSQGVTAQVTACLQSRTIIRLGELLIPGSAQLHAMLEAAVKSDFIETPIRIMVLRTPPDEQGLVRIDCRLLLRNASSIHLDRVELTCDLIGADDEVLDSNADRFAVAASMTTCLERSSSWIEAKQLRNAKVRMALELFHPVTTVECSGVATFTAASNVSSHQDHAGIEEPTGGMAAPPDVSRGTEDLDFADPARVKRPPAPGSHGGFKAALEATGIGDVMNEDGIDPDVLALLDTANAREHAEAFMKNDITFDMISSLVDADLLAMGITSLGQRKRILLAISRLPPAEPRHPTTIDQCPAPPIAARQTTDWDRFTAAFGGQFEALDGLNISPPPGHKKREGARAYATNLQANTRVLLVYDDTVFRSGKDGLLVSELGVHWRNNFSPPGFTPWAALPAATANGKSVVLSPGGTLDCNWGRAKCAAAIARFVNLATGAALASIPINQHPQARFLTQALAEMMNQDENGFVVVEARDSGQFVQFCNTRNGVVLDLVHHPDASPEADRMTGLLGQLGGFTVDPDATSHDPTSSQRVYQSDELDLASSHGLLALRSIHRLASDVPINLTLGWEDSGTPDSSRRGGEVASHPRGVAGEDRTLRIYCTSKRIRDEVVRWLESHWAEELASISQWEPDPDGSGTWGIFADGAIPDLKDDVEEAFGEAIETDWD